MADPIITPARPPITKASEHEIALRVQAVWDREHGLLTRKSWLDYVYRLGDGWDSPRSLLGGAALVAFNDAYRAKVRDDERARSVRKAENPDCQYADGGWDDDEDDLAQHIGQLVMPEGIQISGYHPDFWMTYLDVASGTEFKFKFRLGSRFDVEQQHLEAISRLRNTKPGTRRVFNPEPVRKPVTDFDVDFS